MKWCGLFAVAVMAWSFSAALAAGPTTQPASQPTTQDVPNEPMSKNTDRFRKMHAALVERAARGDIDIYFVGDSITEGWGRKPVWLKYYEPLKAANFGISSDRTSQVLWRLQNGELSDAVQPKVFVLLIGTNNVNHHSVEQIADGIGAIVKLLRQRRPTAKVLLLGIFPRGEKTNPLREKIAKVNERIARLDDGDHVRYLYIGDRFLGSDGTISKEVMKDYLHPTAKGYEIWAQAMNPLLMEMLGRPATQPAENK